jgi:hypothetical protein
MPVRIAVKKFISSDIQSTVKKCPAAIAEIETLVQRKFDEEGFAQSAFVDKITTLLQRSGVPARKIAAPTPKTGILG